MRLRGRDSASGDVGGKLGRVLERLGVKGAWWFVQRLGRNGEHVLRHGRAHVRADVPRFELGAEWSFPTRHCLLFVRFESGGDAAITVGAALPWLVGVWLHFDSRLAERLATRLCPGEHQWSTELGIRAYTSEGDPFVSWNVFTCPDSWESTRPRWRDGTAHPLDWLFGKDGSLQEETTATVRVEIPLPEGKYPATVELRRRVFGRERWPRWPFLRVIRSANVKPDEPLPVPGKGTCSWNLDEDAIHELYTGGNVDTVAGAVSHVVGSVLRSRERYGGGVDWRPERGRYGTAPDGGNDGGNDDGHGQCHAAGV